MSRILTKGVMRGEMRDTIVRFVMLQAGRCVATGVQSIML
jgi:hypothetical protein